ncbi:unnamed protein product [Caenorhabditis bovis]|uniref:Uncharacterized protein n=1 Tax=Caenorhabditis bovis TaxID=2654633 RepID=A0A8S1F7T2_9PELO|nr:unnamed protein product [Caenorhabditis bovis]
MPFYIQTPPLTPATIVPASAHSNLLSGSQRDNHLVSDAEEEIVVDDLPPLRPFRPLAEIQKTYSDSNLRKSSIRTPQPIRPSSTLFNPNLTVQAFLQLHRNPTTTTTMMVSPSVPSCLSKLLIENRIGTIIICLSKRPMRQ